MFPGHEVLAGFVEDQLHDLGRFTGACGQGEGGRAGGNVREVDEPSFGDRDDLRGDDDHVTVPQLRGLGGQDTGDRVGEVVDARDGGEGFQGERAEGAGRGARVMRLRVGWAVMTPDSRVWAAASRAAREFGGVVVVSQVRTRWT
ncbi:hypothetical protein GCM10010289_73060 [Streptomyces violascens]|nr:hypothetical protein GCM10010289_73060 [Streptomyces violascens]